MVTKKWTVEMKDIRDVLLLAVKGRYSACDAIASQDEQVTFTNVAEKAGVARTSLYRDPILHAVVEEYRIRIRNPQTASPLLFEIAHLRTAIEALADRVRQHEERLRRLEPGKTKKAM